MYCVFCYEDQDDYGHYQRADFVAYGTSLCDDHYWQVRDQNDADTQNVRGIVCASHGFAWPCYSEKNPAVPCKRADTQDSRENSERRPV